MKIVSSDLVIPSTKTKEEQERRQGYSGLWKGDRAGYTVGSAYCNGIGNDITVS